MKKILLLMGMCVLFLGGTALGQTLTAGDIAIIGVGVDDEEVLLVALADIPSGESVFITDDEWATTLFNSGEGFLEWVTPAISAGDVFTFTTSGVTGVTGSDQGTVTSRAGSFALGNSGDGVYLYQTSTNVYNTGTYTILGFAGEDSGDAGTLTGTGLTEGEDAVFFAGDNGIYNGVRTGEDAAGYLGLIYDSAEWTTSGTAQTLDETSFTITSGAVATKLVVNSVNNNSSPSVSTNFDIIVELQDVDNNTTTATQDTSITLALTTGTGALGGTLTGTVISGNSSVTFSNITYDVAESGVSITATNTGGSLSAGTSSIFTVLSVADELVLVSIPASGFTDTGLSSFTVEARRSGDSSVDLNYSSSITISKASGTGTIGGTLTQAASSGVATFGDITFDTAGDFTIQATDGSLTSSASSTISIVEVSIVLNEILADPDATGGDANGDGVVSTSNDEFVEFVNTGSSDLDISNWTISDGASTRHTFAASTILKSNQAVVIFASGTPTGDFGDALVFTASTSSLGLNNTGDTITLRDDSDNTVVEVTYNSDAGDNQSITRSPDLTGDFAKHETADIGDASSFSPGTKLDGTTFQIQVGISGTEGWRLISTPISGATFDDVLGDLWTQGFTGADSPTDGTSNVYDYDETVTTGDLDDGYESVSDQSNAMSDGVGYAVYVFEDDDFATGGTQGGFPKTISVFGDSTTTNVGPVSFTFTSSGIPANDGWNLTGNPFGDTLNVDDLGFDSDSDIDDFAYVYRSGSFSALDAGGASGETINVGEGFFVKVDAAVSYTFPIAAAPSKVVPKESYTVSFNLSDATMKSNASIRFHEDAEFGKEGKDAYYFRSLETSYFGLFSKDGELNLSVNSYPLDYNGSVNTPLTITGNREGMLTLGWNKPEGLDKGWTYELVDNVTDQRYDLTNEGSMEFNYDGNELDRFSLITTTGTAVSNEPGEVVERFALDQNYPNPFNPSTTINYSVENTGQVSLSVYNVMGQKVAELVNGTKAAGSYNVSWNASGAASGMYYYRLEAGGQVLTRKMTLIK